MGFTAGSNINVGATVTHTQWNAYYGASGSVDYLKTEADKLDDVSMSADLTGTRALATNYTNGAKAKLVTVTARLAAGFHGVALKAYVDSVNVASVEADATTSMDYVAVTFIVPAGLVYRVSGYKFTVTNWYEWELF